MKLKEKEHILFEEWKIQQGHPYFISDGILDEEEWNKQPCKILQNKDKENRRKYLKSISKYGSWTSIKWNNDVVCLMGLG